MRTPIQRVATRPKRGDRVGRGRVMAVVHHVDRDQVYYAKFIGSQGALRRMDRTRWRRAVLAKAQFATV